MRPDWGAKPLCVDSRLYANNGGQPTPELIKNIIHRRSDGGETDPEGHCRGKLL